jgi:uncharacterized protein (DUF1810 family)
MFRDNAGAFISPWLIGKRDSSMTLFSEVQHADPSFEQVLDKFFNGRKVEKTLELLAKLSSN